MTPTPRPPAGSNINCHSNFSTNYPVLKLTERASWFIANGLHVPPIAYKLHSLSHLPGVILQVAGTPTQGVLVSDRIGAFPYRPFSSAEQTLTILAKTPALRQCKTATSDTANAVDATES